MGLLHHLFWLEFVFGTFWHHFQLFNYFVWLRITEEGSASEMRIWSILLINSDLKWCICLSRSLLLYLITLVYFFRDPSVSPYLDLIRCPGQVCSVQWRRFLTTTSVWSVVFILSDLYLCTHISRYLFSVFQLLGECHCWWIKLYERTHLPKFYGRLQLNCSVFRASKLFDFCNCDIVLSLKAYLLM